VKLVRSIAVFALLPIGFARPIVGRLGLVGLLAAVAAAYAVLLAIVRVARRMEQRADGSHIATIPNAGTYARALEKAYRANGNAGGDAPERPVHPHLYDRLTAAGVVSRLPAPRRPARKRALAGMLLAAAPRAATADVWVFPRFALSERTIRIARPLGGLPRQRDVRRHAGLLHAGDEDPAQAIAWLALAHALDRAITTPAPFAAELLAYHGRCDRARSCSAEAEERARRRSETTRTRLDPRTRTSIDALASARKRGAQGI
jgi:hypothetical protein